MSALTVKLPESLYKNIKSLARKEGCSMNQFVATAAAEKMAAIMTLDYLKREASKGRRKDFEQYLTAVPDAEPAEGDKIN